MLPAHLRRNDAELKKIRVIVDGGKDGPVLMMNLNRCTPEAQFPDGVSYRRYFDGLESTLAAVGARILRRAPVFGQALGTHNIHEILAVWYPIQKTFLDLSEAQGAGGKLSPERGVRGLRRHPSMPRQQLSDRG